MNLNWYIELWVRKKGAWTPETMADGNNILLKCTKMTTVISKHIPEKSSD